MQYDSIMVRYGELSLKGKNKKTFIDTLSNNIRFSLADMKELKFEKQYDRFYVKLSEFSDVDEILNRLKKIPGIHNYSLVRKQNKEDKAQIKNTTQNDKIIKLYKKLLGQNISENVEIKTTKEVQEIKKKD